MEPSLKGRQAWAKALECLEEARLLLANRLPAGAVARAYYAMFHAAEAALIARFGLEFSSHAAVQSAFGKHFAKTDLVPRRLHKLLIRAFEARQEPDYELGARMTLDEARERATDAEEFIAGLRPIIEAGDATNPPSGARSPTS